MNKILLTSLLVLCSSISSAKVDQINLEECKDNADLLGYVTSIQGICGLDVDQKSKLMQYINQTNRQCITKYGEKSIANATKMGIFSVKAEMDEMGRNSTCARALQDYSEFFDFRR